MDYTKYFEIQGDSLIFTGDKLEIFIPDRYANHGYLSITNTIKTIGVFDMLINGSIEDGYFLANTITMAPSEIKTETHGANKLHRATFNKGDVFIKNLTLVKDDKIAYVLFYEYIYAGHYPKFMEYEKVITMFDKINKASGMRVSVNHSVYEMLYAMSFRNPKNLIEAYRHVMGTGVPPMPIALNRISLFTQSTTGMVIGSYMAEGLDVALVTDPKDLPTSPIENLLRK